MTKKSTRPKTRKKGAPIHWADEQTRAVLAKYSGLLAEYPGRKNKKIARVILISTELPEFENLVPAHLRADEDVSEGSYIWNKVVAERDDHVDLAEFHDIRLQIHSHRILKPEYRGKFVRFGASSSHFLRTQTEIREQREARKLWNRRLKSVDRLWEKIYDQTQGATEEERIVATRREVIEQLLSTEKGIQIWQSPDFDQSGQAWSHIVNHPESLCLMRWEKIAPKLVEIYKAFVAKRDAGDEHPNASPDDEPLVFDFEPVEWPW